MNRSYLSSTTPSRLSGLLDVKMGFVMGTHPSEEDTENTLQFIRDAFRVPVVDIKPIFNGFTNQVYVFQLENDQIFVIKKGKHQFCYDQFKKAEIFTSIAREHKIPVPEIVLVTNYKNFAFQVSKYISGIPGNVYTGRREAIWEELGQIARRINSISVPFFGSKFDSKHGLPLFYTSWKEYLNKEIESCLTKKFYNHLKFLKTKHLNKLDELLAEYKQLEFRPKLIHGDLWLKNIKVDELGKVTCILDWENVTSGYAPYAEFAYSFEHRRPEETAAFEKGYGLSEVEKSNMKKYQEYILTLDWFLKHLSVLIEGKDYKSAEHHEELLKNLLEDFDKAIKNIQSLTKRENGK